MVFVLIALFRLDATTTKQLIGLASALAGLTVLVVFASPTSPGVGLMTAVALVVPLCYTLEYLLISCRWPTGVDSFLGLGSMQIIATMFGGLLAYGSRSGLPVHNLLDLLSLLVLCIGLSAAMANWLFQALVKRFGSIFASQSSYIITLAGAGWSVLLLGEPLPVSLWIGVAAVLLGISIVQLCVAMCSPNRVTGDESVGVEASLTI